MVRFDLYVSGEKIAGELAREPEEAAAFFQELIREAKDDFADGIAEFLDHSERQEVAAFLTLLAEKIGGAE